MTPRPHTPSRFSAFIRPGFIVQVYFSNPVVYNAYPKIPRILIPDRGPMVRIVPVLGLEYIHGRYAEFIRFQAGEAGFQ